METIAELEQLGYDTPIPVTNNRARHGTRTNPFQTTTTEHDEHAYDGVEEITIANLLKHDTNMMHMMMNMMSKRTTRLRVNDVSKVVMTKTFR